MTPKSLKTSVNPANTQTDDTKLKGKKETPEILPLRDSGKTGKVIESKEVFLLLTFQDHSSGQF